MSENVWTAVLWFIGMVLMVRIALNDAIGPKINEPRWAIVLVCAFWPFIVVLAVVRDYGERLYQWSVK